MMNGYFNESATAKCPTKDYFPFFQWMFDVPDLVKIPYKSKQNMEKISFTASEKSFENVDRRMNNGQRMPAYIIISPMSLWLR